MPDLPRSASLANPTLMTEIASAPHLKTRRGRQRANDPQIRERRSKLDRHDQGGPAGLDPACAINVKSRAQVVMLHSRDDPDIALTVNDIDHDLTAGAAQRDIHRAGADPQAPQHDFVKKCGKLRLMKADLQRSRIEIEAEA